MALKKVDIDLLEDANDGYDDLYLEGKLFTGIATEENPHSETGYRDGKLHGPARVWHPNGVLAEEEYSSMGPRHGFRRKWNEEGVLLLEELWEHATLILRRVFDGKGQIVEEKSMSCEQDRLQQWNEGKRCSKPLPVVELVDDEFVEVSWPFDRLVQKGVI